MPRINPCGPRTATFDAFRTELQKAGAGDYIGLWVDSEDPVESIDQPWEHLNKRDKWKRPAKANDDNVLLMVTCMESLIAADRAALAKRFGSSLVAAALPPPVNLEARDRHQLLDQLKNATRECTTMYTKGKVSFEVLALLNAETLQKQLPSFARTIRILQQKLR